MSDMQFCKAQVRAIMPLCR